MVLPLFMLIYCCLPKFTLICVSFLLLIQIWMNICLLFILRSTRYLDMVMRYLLYTRMAYIAVLIGLCKMQHESDENGTKTLEIY